MAGILYYNDRKSFNKSILRPLGEIQTNFNMSFTLDGTKDSCKVQVLSFKRETLQPYTICFLEELGSWWIVASDKTERHANESGFLYVHNIQLVGAIELLNARDLTDCGFYQNRYTIDTFTKRLFALSNFEYDLVIVYSNILNKDQVVDYIKTYENYTLLSALKDFYGGYNCEVKLSFSYTTNVHGVRFLSNAILIIHSKTGRRNTTKLMMSSFKDIRETKTINKNSYGTIVVSNTDNITASKMQVYPVFGGMPLMSDSFQLDTASSYIKLPSNLNDIEWVKMYALCELIFSTPGGSIPSKSIIFYNYDKKFIETSIDELDDYIRINAPAVYNVWQNNKEMVIENMLDFGVSTFKKGININATTGKFENPNNLLIPEIHTLTKQVQLILCEKEVKQALGGYNAGTYDGIGYERGSNKILIDFYGYLTDYDDPLGYVRFEDDNKSFDCGYISRDLINETGILVQIRPYSIRPQFLRFSAKYEPMADLKLKVDNDLETNDIQIYNQNGKLTDGNAFSKLLNSYSKEITTDNITRYCQYYNINSLPIIGQLVVDDDTEEEYVINNISYNFILNEKSTLGVYPYMIETEITMSKAIAVKSLMVNPNSNIRDYGIPQKHMVKRKELFRDYCEFDFDSDTSENDYYFRFDNALTLDLNGTMYEMVRCGIKVSFPDNSNYYYQLDTTRYVFKKLLVTMVDFQDNNIIGNDMQNQFSGFDISRVLAPWGMSNLTNTPIQYTNDNGVVKDIDLLWLTGEQYSFGIDEYINDYDSSKIEYKYQLTSRCFINSDIYDSFENNGYEFETNVENYNKDPLEIPVFEHTFQMGDTRQVEVGSDIFALHEELFRYYYYNLFAFEFVDKNKLNEFNALKYSTHNISYELLGFKYSQSATIQPVGGNSLHISLYERYNSNQNPSHINKITNIPTDKDLAIYRYEYSYSLNKTIKSLMFIIHLSEDTPISPTNDIILYAHQWKLN